MNDYRNVLVLVSDSERSRQVLTCTARARDRVLEACRASGMSIEFESPAGDPVEGMSARLRVADLAVVGQPSDEDTDGASRRFASKMLVAAGCPVLFVPGTGTVDDASIAELLLSHAADIDANLIVMGGYGHIRTYELLLGGVTRTMLGSMTVPVLMSH